MSSLQSIQQWYERGYKTVAENGSHWVQLRLSSDGQVWQTWDKPFPPPEEFTKELTALFEMLCEDLPVRKHSMQLSAENGAGGVLATATHTLLGKNKNAQELGQQGAAKAFSDAMRSLAETTDMVLRSARDQLAAQNIRIDKDGEEIRALHELLREHRAAELLAEHGNGAVSEALIEQLKGAGPVLTGLAELWIERAKQKAVDTAKTAVVAAVTPAADVSAATPAKPVVTVTATPK